MVPVELHDVFCNGAAIEELISGSAVIKPNFSLTGTVNYYTGVGSPVSEVTISATAPDSLSLTELLVNGRPASALAILLASLTPSSPT